MLPTIRPGRESSETVLTRYVDLALKGMIHRLEKLGAQRGEIEVKLFGCCDVLDFDVNRITVGRMNAEMAMKVLSEEGVVLAARQTGGPVGMYIYFTTDSGEVLLRRLAPLETGLRKEAKLADGR
ncbi:chemotaxis protein CheD [Bryocella elongata]|nr:chemotaxis protein CheD [Bryocella elongata]